MRISKKKVILMHISMAEKYVTLILDIIWTHAYM